MQDRLASRPQAFFVAGALGMGVALAVPFLTATPAAPRPAAVAIVAVEDGLQRTEPAPPMPAVDRIPPDGPPAPLGPPARVGQGAGGADGPDDAWPDDAWPDDAGLAHGAPATPAPPPREVSGRLPAGRTIAQALGEAGIGAAAVHEIVAALARQYDFRRAPAGAAWEATLSADGARVDRFRFEPSPREILEAVRAEGSGLTGRREETPLDVRTVRVEARIESSLYEAIEESGESPALASLVADVFAWDLDFSRDQQPGDSFSMLVEKRFVGGRFLDYGRVLAAEYAGRKGTYRAFWFQPEGGRGRYYLEDGRSAEKVFLATPLEFTRVSSRFDRHRKHPILGFTRAHHGTDFAAPRGTPVRAMADGLVTFSGRKGGSGKLVVIRHDNGMESCYAHLDRIERGISSGRRVRQKEMIGRVGSTGLATGPHLHLGVKQKGRWLDPQRLPITRSEPLAERHRVQFGAAVAERLALLRAPAPATSRATLAPEVGRADALGAVAQK